MKERMKAKLKRATGRIRFKLLCQAVCTTLVLFALDAVFRWAVDEAESVTVMAYAIFHYFAIFVSITLYLFIIFGVRAEKFNYLYELRGRCRTHRDLASALLDDDKKSATRWQLKLHIVDTIIKEDYADLLRKRLAKDAYMGAEVYT